MRIAAAMVVLCVLSGPALAWDDGYSSGYNSGYNDGPAPGPMSQDPYAQGYRAGQDDADEDQFQQDVQQWERNGRYGARPMW